MNTTSVGVALFLYLAVGSVSLFSFLAVAAWSNARRQEREAFYRAETLKKIAEAQGGESSVALEFLREEAMVQRQRRREGLKLGGLVTMAVGIGLIIYLRAILHGPECLVGIIPCLVGIVLLVYAYGMAPKER